MSEESAAAVTRCIQSFNRLTFGVQNIHTSIDPQSVQRTQDRRSLTGSIEWRFIQCQHPVAFLAEVFVLTLGAKFVVAVDGGDKLICRYMQFFSEFF